MRKEIDTIDHQKTTSFAEKFQNTVVRQVIKGMHHWLMVSFEQYLIQKHVNLCVLEDDKKMEYINSVFKNDHKYRNYLVGAVTGQFSTEELVQYHQGLQEINKRIVKIIEQRIIDSLNELCP